MILPRKLNWPRLVMLVLVTYWIILATATHVPTLPTGSISYHDKTAHYLGYGVLAFLISWAWTTRWTFFPTGMVVALGTASLYGAVDELTQALVPGRVADYYDWFADVVGSMTGVLLFWATEKSRRWMCRLGA